MDNVLKYCNTKSKIILLQFDFGFGMPIKLEEQSLTMSTVMRFVYQLPSNATVFTDPYATVQKRSRKQSTRWNMYSRLQAFLDR